jgi:hypothetical protein
MHVSPSKQRLVGVRPGVDLVSRQAMRTHCLNARRMLDV